MSWMDILKPVVNAGITAYSNYQQQKDQDKYIDMVRQAEQARQDYDQQMLAYQMAVSAPKYSGSSGGGGGYSRPKVTKDMIATFQNYNQKAEDALMPWVNAGKEVLPAATDGYKYSLDIANQLLKQMAESDLTTKLNQSVSPNQVQFNIRRAA